jgi:HAD superfamily hydrolase (TIGR01509 family)
MRGIIFDLDETLVATSALWRRATVQLFHRLGHEWSHEIAEKYRGMNIRDVATVIHRELGIQSGLEESQSFLRAELERQFEIGPIAPKTGAVACVQRLEGCAPMAVASGSPLHLIERALRILNIRKAFAAVLSSEGLEKGKPDPAVFLAAAEALNADPRSCLVFEDSLVGAQAARAAGMACFLIPSSAQATDPSAADRIFSSLEEVTLEDVTEFLNAQR